MSGRGFASMSPERRRECARLGYETAVEYYGREFAFANLAKGRRFTSKKARSAPEVQAHAPASGERPVEADSTETGVATCI